MIYDFRRVTATGPAGHRQEEDPWIYPAAGPDEISGLKIFSLVQLRQKRWQTKVYPAKHADIKFEGFIHPLLHPDEFVIFRIFGSISVWTKIWKMCPDKNRPIWGVGPHWETVVQELWANNVSTYLHSHSIILPVVLSGSGVLVWLTSHLLQFCQGSLLLDDPESLRA